MQPPEPNVENNPVHRIVLSLLLSLSLLLPGCIGSPSDPAATQPATNVNPAKATAAYWYDQPSVASVEYGHYDRLWEAAADAARDNLFTIDRRNYRQGVLTTEPMVSKQFFEFWRSDVVTPYDLTRSSLQTLRRTIHFRFQREGAERWAVIPKVVVEQFSSAGRRITYVGAYTWLSAPVATGNAETDEGIYLPAQYWHAIGRDHALEKKLARDISRRLQGN